MSETSPGVTVLDKLSDAIGRLACPLCKTSLVRGSERFSCVSCNTEYPILNGVPILISEKVSTFRIADYTKFQPAHYSKFREQMRALFPKITKNFVAAKNFKKFGEQLLRRSPSPVVLVLGGAEVGSGLRALLDDTRFRFVETDVVIGSRTMLVCDANFVPFLDDTFDGVIIQAVLEYLPDPSQSVDEIYRVLAPGGLVYSEMPFIQTVHGGAHDFGRLTCLGHRRLYRHFQEIESGPCAGPATALSWTTQQLLLTFSGSRVVRDIIKLLCACGLFWLKYLDLLLLHRPGALDGATGTYFLGTKSQAVLSDAELISLYKGAVPSGHII